MVLRRKKKAPEADRYPLPAKETAPAFRYGLKMPNGFWVSDSSGVWRFDTEKDASDRLAKGDMPAGTKVEPLP